MTKCRKRSQQQISKGIVKHARCTIPSMHQLHFHGHVKGKKGLLSWAGSSGNISSYHSTISQAGLGSQSSHVLLYYYLIGYFPWPWQRLHSATPAYSSFRGDFVGGYPSAFCLFYYRGHCLDTGGLGFLFLHVLFLWLAGASHR